MTTPSERALPPLPEPEMRLYDPTKPNGRASSMVYTAEEMRAYAQTAVGQSTEAQARHGTSCPKVVHKSNGCLHAADDDGPYEVDGLMYCGRCHFWMGTRP